jgi:hypothetical protein
MCTDKDLAASLKRCAFLLNSARLVITDPAACARAAEAVAEAHAVLARHEAIPTGEATDTDFGEFLAAQGVRL